MRAALLSFKANISSPSNWIASWETWEGDDCCKWRGVTCSNRSSHVVELNLGSLEPLDFSAGNRPEALAGEINPSLLVLTHLRSLNLSTSFLYGFQIPEFFGSFKNLHYLDLSGASFAGRIPPHIGNLTRLRYLAITTGYSKIYADNLWWLSHLSSLKHLDLTGVSLVAVQDWLQAVNMLPDLRVLRLEFCGLTSIPASLSYVNFTSLDTLDLANNNFVSALPQWFGNLSRLTNLLLDYCGFHGSIPDAIGNMTSLTNLQLPSNNLDGEIPRSVQNLCFLTTINLLRNNISGNVDELIQVLQCSWNKIQKLWLAQNKFTGYLPNSVEEMTSLNSLDLSRNTINGPIPKGIGMLSQLSYLDLNYNSFNGVVSEAHFANLTSLETLRMSMNSITIVLNENWIPPFQLVDIRLRNCQLGPRFPLWLRWQTNASLLDFSSTGISDSVPEWFWNTFPNIVYANFSHNKLSGKLIMPLETVKSLGVVVLSSNQIEGSIPSPLLDVNSEILDLSNNSLSGRLPQINGASGLSGLFLANNLINSSIPSFLCKATSLSYLDLSNNHLTGGIPQCWNSSNLIIISLANNNLSGGIPSSMGTLYSLEILNLSNNSLSGLIPASLQGCTSLNFLDLGHNKFSGTIPTWLGEAPSFLKILHLRSNMFSGDIPTQLGQLENLQILDLADNNLSGTIPKSFGNLSAMTTQPLVNLAYDQLGMYEDGSFSYQNSLLVVIKGEELDYTTTLALVNSMDFSNNNLSGNIPKELGSLEGLLNLNLSGNYLTGRIPENIGGLQSIESLDLSRNQLSGTIPLSISSLTFLSHLNLSFNHLSGRIPSGHQLQTLDDPSIYTGNSDLCGPPLAKNCSSNVTFYDGGKDEKDDDEMEWFYLSMGLGYIVGFWAVCSVLLFKRSWRYACFRFFDDMYDKLYLAAIMMLALKREME